MDQIDSMRLFVTVAEVGSFSEAGRRLGLAPSSVSRQIGSLEERLSAQLLTRSTRKLSLTEAGHVYFEHASRILSDVKEAEMAVSALEMAPRGVLRATVPLAFGQAMIAPLLPEFLCLFPDLKVDLFMTDNYVDLIGEGIDMAVRIGRLPDSSLIARKIAENPRVLVASPGYTARKGAPEKPEELIHHNCMTHRFQMRGDTWTFRRDQRVVEVQVGGNLQINNVEALRYAACHAQGIANLPEWSIESDLKSGRLTRILPQWTVTPNGEESLIYAVYPPNRRMSLKVRAFTDFLADRLQPHQRGEVLRPNMERPPARKVS